MAETEGAQERKAAIEGAAAPSPAAAESGQPISDVPPLVEFGFDDPAVAAQPEVSRQPEFATQRPLRRRFLAPIDEAAARLPDVRPVSVDLRPRAPVRVPAPPAVAPNPALRAEREPADVPTRPARRWRRSLAVTAGVGLALVLAIAVEVGIDPAWLHRLRTVAMQHLPGWLESMPKGRPPSEPAERAAYYAARARAGDAEAAFSLAVIYAKGEGVKQDYEASAKWFRAAAEHGVARAQYDLGVLCERGRGVPVDYTEAVEWYRKAAEQNYALAQYNLAVAYTKGEGVPRDSAEAAKWYRRAALQGVVAAMVNLAIQYERGDGIDTSAVDAYGWYRAAARRGSQPASQRADALLKAFSPADQTSAEDKTTKIAGAIHDAIGDSARTAERPALKAQANTVAGAPAPVLKSGIANGGGAGHDDLGGENP